MTDEIIKEVWQSKDRIAKEFKYDISVLAAELQRQQQKSGRKVVNLAKKTTEQAKVFPQ
jgi:hypothetical protein